MRSAQSTLRSAEMIQLNRLMRSSVWPKPTFQNAIQASTAAIIRNEVVISSAARGAPGAGRPHFRFGMRLVNNRRRIADLRPDMFADRRCRVVLRALCRFAAWKARAGAND